MASGHDIPIREGDIIEFLEADGVRATGRYVGLTNTPALGPCLGFASDGEQSSRHIVSPTQLVQVKLIEAGPAAVMAEGQTFVVQPGLVRSLVLLSGDPFVRRD